MISNRNSIKKERRKSSINSVSKQKRNSINLTKRSSVNFGKEQEKFVKRNSVIVTQGNVNTQALETLSNAAIKVQNLLSDFLENADDDDKQKFNIAEELKQIKENKNNQNLNIFSIIGNNSGKSSDSDNKNNKNKNNNTKSSLINRGKAASSLLLSNEDDLGRQQIKHNSRKEGRSKFIENSNSIEYISKRNSVNLVPNRPLAKNFNNLLNNEGADKKKNKVHFQFNQDKEKNNKMLSSEKSNFNRKRKRKRTYQVKQKINIIGNNHMNLNPNNFFLNKSHSFRGNRSNSLLELSSEEEKKNEKENKNYIQEENDIRNYIPLSKSKYQKFTNLCKNLRKSIVFSSELFKKQSILTKNQEQKKESLINMQSIQEESTFQSQNINEMNKEINDTFDSDIYNYEQNKKIREFQFRRLVKQDKYVYDSLSDEESLDDIEGEFYIDPTNNFKFYFDLILFFLAIFSITYPIYVFGFKLSPSTPFQTKGLKIFEFIMDFFCFIDLIFGFFTAYYDFDENLITNNYVMVLHYLSSWFTIDFLSAIPFNSYIIIVEPFKDIQKDKLRYIEDNSLYDLLILIRILKLFKVFLHNAFIDKINKSIEGIDALDKWMRVYVSLFAGFAAIHILSCIFIFLGTLQFPNWIYVNGYELTNQQTDIYVTALYYIVATVFTIGYGDIVSVSLYERFYNLILLVVGIMIYSYSVSALSNYVQTVDSKTLDYQNKIEILEQIRVSHEKMPNDLYDKISKFLLYRLHHSSGDKNEIIDTLPTGLRNKLILEMYRDIIYNFIFFKKFYNTDFIIQVVLAFKPIQALRNEKLVKEGEYIEEIFFVKRGVLSLEIPLPVVLKNETIQKMETMRFAKAQRRFGIRNATLNFLKQRTLSNGNNSSPSELDIPTNEELKNKNGVGQIKDMRQHQQYIKIIEIRRNEHFGDILMFLNKRSPLSVKVKTKVCELFLLKKTDAVEISMNFPKIWRKIIKKSLFNMEQIERLINKTLKFFFVHNEGQHIRRDSIIRGNYYRVDPTKSNKLLNSNNLFQNLETSELQSIPTEGEEEEDEDGEDENDNVIKEVNSSQTESSGTNSKSKSKSSNSSKSESSKSSDSSSSSDSKTNSNSLNSENDDKKSDKENNEKKQLKSNLKNINKIESEENKNEDINNNENNDEIHETKISQTVLIEDRKRDFNNEDDTQRLFENSFNESQRTHRSSLQNKSNMSERTVKTLIRNSLFDIKSINNDKENIIGFFKEKDKGTLFSSNSLTLPYSLDEINNENLPFEEISLHNEDMPSILYSPEFKNNYINLNQILAYAPLNKNKSFLINENTQNLASIYGDNNIDIINTEFNSTHDKKIFKNLSRHNIISFTIYGIKKFKKKKKKTLKKETSSKTIRSNNDIKSENSKSENGKSENSKIENKSKNNDFSPKKTSKQQLTRIKPKNNLNTPKNLDRRLSKMIFSSPKKEVKSDNEENETINAHRDNFILKEVKLSPRKKGIRSSKTFEDYNNSDSFQNNVEKMASNKLKIKKKDTLEIISKNIEKNSINLNNPNEFYSNYFSSIIGKKDIQTHENGVSTRLNKIKELIQNKNNKNKEMNSNRSGKNSTHSSNIPFIRKIST